MFHKSFPPQFHFCLQAYGLPSRTVSSEQPGFAFYCFYHAVYAVIVCPSVRPSICPSVCLSVRTYVTSRSFTKMAEPRITQITPYDSSWILICRCRKSSQNSNGITPTGAPNKGGVDSDRPLSRYISKTVQGKDIVTMED